MQLTSPQRRNASGEQRSDEPRAIFDTSSTYAKLEFPRKLRIYFPKDLRA